MPETKVKRQELQYIRNFPFPKNQWFTKEKIESALDYVPRDDDIIIVNYPKTGTNWTKYIILEILNKGDPLPSTFDLNFIVVPYVELTGSDAAMKLSSPRFIGFHLPYHLTPINPLAKYIYVARNPKDTLVSFYYFTQETSQIEILFDDFFEMFLTGQVAYGDYFDHLLSWYEHKDNPNLLLLSYEQLKADPRSQIFRIAEFLGQKYLDQLKEDDEHIEMILERTSFSYMKKNLTKPSGDKELNDGKEKRGEELANSNNEREKEEKITFFRKGIVGDWKNHFSAEQNERFEKKMKEKLKGSDIVKLWNVQ